MKLGGQEQGKYLVGVGAWKQYDQNTLNEKKLVFFETVFLCVPLAVL